MWIQSLLHEMEKIEELWNSIKWKLITKHTFIPNFFLFILLSYFVNGNSKHMYFMTTIFLKWQHSEQTNYITWRARNHFNLKIESVYGMIFWSNCMFFVFFLLIMIKEVMKIGLLKNVAKCGLKGQEEKGVAGLRQNIIFFSPFGTQNISLFDSLAFCRISFI